MGPWLPRERENNFWVRRMLHAGGAPAFLCRGPRPCSAALERCACRKAAGRACPAPTFYAGERFTSPRGVFRCHRRARSGQDRSLQTTRYRCIAGRDDRLSKKVCSPLGPLCEGAPPAGGGGENCAVARNISGSDCQKNVFLPCCVCRGDHWSPASLPQQRIFRDSFLQGKRARASNARPYKSFSTVCAFP